MGCVFDSVACCSPFHVHPRIFPEHTLGRLTFPPSAFYGDGLRSRRLAAAVYPIAAWRTSLGVIA